MKPSKPPSPLRPLRPAARATHGAGLRTVRPPEEQAFGRSVYSTWKWQKLAMSVKKERGNRCEKCGRSDTTLKVDHIRELRDGGDAFDPRNMMVLCGSCHTLKTNAAKRTRGWAATADQLLAALADPDDAPIPPSGRPT